MSVVTALAYLGFFCVCETEPKVLKERVKPSAAKKGTASNQL